MPWREATAEQDGPHAEACGCWIWTGRTEKGVPVIRTTDSQTTAARYYWAREKGKPVPAGKVLYALCGNRLCVNPRHREPVTQKERSYRSGEVKLSLDMARRAHHAAKNGMTQSQVAAGYGISRRTAGRLADGSHHHLTNKKGM